MVPTLRSCIALIALFSASSASAQEPGEAWRTLRTEHARIYYPQRASDFAGEVAAQYESIRAEVIAEVGYEMPQRLDIVIRDPYSTANGMALPFLRHPRLELWATPPDATSVIGHYDTWARLLVTHEVAHQVHLLRPSRNGFERALSAVTGIGPVAWKSPRWVAEGYATVVEGRLTPAGRPNGDFRPLLLRTLAREGKLPTYGELDGSSRFLGGAYAYLVGSAYLEWLEARQGEGSLRDLWMRMTSRQSRSFDDAFHGVFGEAPDVLYGRFTAELTADAMASEATQGPTGEVWADLSGAVGTIDINPVAGRVAAVVRGSKRSRLRVWKLAADPEAESRWEERVADTLAADPLDVAPVRPDHFGPESVATRGRRTPVASDPQVLDDGTVLFTGSQRDGNGRIRTDLYTWDPDTGRERRLTHNDDLHSAVVDPSGEWALAVQSRMGQTAIVRLDLGSGQITAVQTAAPDEVLSSPQVSPDGQTLAWSAHRDGSWRIEVQPAEGGDITTLWRPAASTSLTPRFAADSSTVLATVARAGLMEAWQLPLDGGEGQLIASPPGGALHPVDTGDGHLLYATLHADGFDIHRRPLEPAEALPPEPPGLSTRNAPPEDVPELVRAPLGEAKRYGVGPLGQRLLVAGATSAGSSTAILGWRLGDLIGRHQLVAQAGLRAEYGTDALSIAYRSRAIRLFDVDLHGYGMREKLATVEMDRAGVELGISRSGALPAGGWTVRASGLFDAPIFDDTRGNRIVAGASADVAMRGRRSGLWALDAHLRRDFGQTNDITFDRFQMNGGLSFGRSVSVGVRGARGFSSGTSDLDRFRRGGLQTGMLPTLFEANRIHSGAFAPTDVNTSQYAQLRVEASAGLTAYAEHLWLWDEDNMQDGVSTSVGLSGQTSLPAQPLVGLPSGFLEGGLACRLRDFSAEWDEKPCQALDDYALWFGLRWSP